MVRCSRIGFRLPWTAHGSVSDPVVKGLAEPYFLGRNQNEATFSS
jgi:hypothetical protein